MKTQYDYDYFLSFFGSIPYQRWTTHAFCDQDGRRCAVGHFLTREIPNFGFLRRFVDRCMAGELPLNDDTKPKLIALAELFNTGNDLHEAQRTIYAINNGTDPQYKQKTPRARILAALNDAKARAEAALEQYESRPLKPLSVVPPDNGTTGGPSHWVEAVPSVEGVAS